MACPILIIKFKNIYLFYNLLCPNQNKLSIKLNNVRKAGWISVRVATRTLIQPAAP